MAVHRLHVSIQIEDYKFIQENDHSASALLRNKIRELKDGA